MKIMKKLSLPQKNMLVLIFTVVCAFVVFCFFVYFPTWNSIIQIKENLSNVENQIREIEAMVGKSETIDESKSTLREMFTHLNSKFSQDEKESFKMISDFARKLNIGIISIRPTPRTPFLDTDNQKIIVEGKVCQKIGLSMEMRCSYKDLVEYIKALKESLPAVFAVERLKITKDTAATVKLYITLDLNLYTLS